MYAQAAGNVFYGNNFINNVNHLNANRPADTLFSLPQPDGGNYWDTYDTVAEGCSDTESDGFCDTAYQHIAILPADEYPRLTPYDVTEVTPQCDDGLDNDDDGFIDYPDDPGCLSADDILEINAVVTPAPTCVITASPSTITVGESTTVTWSSENADSASITGGLDLVQPEGSETTSPTETIMYTMNVTGPGGDGSCSTTVVVQVEEISLGEQAAQNAIELANLVSLSEGYLFGAKGWNYEQGRFVSPSEVATGYRWNNIFTNQVETGIGLDCSGLVMWAYNYANDPSLRPEENFIKESFSAFQARSPQSVSVSVEELQPGDLLFYDFGEASQYEVDHVAMYVGDQGSYAVVNATDEDNGIQTFPLAVMTGLDDFLFTRRPVDAQLGMLVQASSPVDIVLTDQDGLRVSSEIMEVTQSEYVQSLGDWTYAEITEGHDGLPADTIYSLQQKPGEYLIEVIPHADASPDDTYSLRFVSGDEEVLLASEEPLDTIPEVGFALTVTDEGEIVMTESERTLRFVRQDVDRGQVGG
ncbi:MAG: NlpC/P60 family protein, partial [Bacteroidota bacterium]